MSTYAAGGTIRLSVQVDYLGALTDPATIAIVVKDAGGGVASYSPTRDGVGLYHYDLATTTGSPVGQWWYRSATTSPNGASQSNSFYVTGPGF